jgi:hypothetical protein
VCESAPPIDPPGYCSYCNFNGSAPIGIETAPNHSKATLPSRNLRVELVIRRNLDPAFAASHLMEVKFNFSGPFIGGSIAGLPGVLLKNEQLVQGSPLVGASARVVGNDFLFAFSSAPADVARNMDLLQSRKWIDLALIYASGKRAIITLKKTGPLSLSLLRSSPTRGKWLDTSYSDRPCGGSRSDRCLESTLQNPSELHYRSPTFYEIFCAGVIMQCDCWRTAANVNA